MSIEIKLIAVLVDFLYKKYCFISGVDDVKNRYSSRFDKYCSDVSNVLNNECSFNDEKYNSVIELTNSYVYDAQEFLNEIKKKACKFSGLYKKGIPSLQEELSNINNIAKINSYIDKQFFVFFAKKHSDHQDLFINPQNPDSLYCTLNYIEKKSFDSFKKDVYQDDVIIKKMNELNIHASKHEYFFKKDSRENYIIKIYLIYKEIFSTKEKLINTQ